MQDYRLGEIEARFADLIWENAPVSSGELVKLAEAAIGWKKSTTYTILRRLCQRGIFRNEGGTVTACLSKAEWMARQSEAFIDEAFAGSLPAFLAAFSARKKLTEGEIDAIRRIIDEDRG